MADDIARRDVVISFRVTAGERDHLAVAGAVLPSGARRPGDLCRAVSLRFAKQRVPPPAKPMRFPVRRRPSADVEALSRVLAAIGKVGGNINQLAHQANVRGPLPTQAALAVIGVEITAIRNAVTAALRSHPADHGGTLDHQG